MPERLGEFRIVRLIAAGGMGEVYEAEQQSLQHRRVAIKVIRRGYVSRESKARFLREQAVLARLHQTNVVPVYTAGEQDGLQYFVMPYIEGASLNRVLEEARQETKGSRTPTLGEIASRAAHSGDQSNQQPAEPLADTKTFHPAQRQRSPRRTVPSERLMLSAAYFRSAAEVMAEAGQAIQHAHDAGYLHRDLKPSNIMVDRDCHCWIIDFGLAGRHEGEGRHRAAASVESPAPPDGGLQTSTGFLGTLLYMAPEQVAGKADARSDVYGLGATLYELCTLRPPFTGTEAELRERIPNSQVTSPRRFANLPKDLSAICLKAMNRSPQQRYQTAAEFSEDLRRWLRHEPIRATRVNAVRRFFLWCRRSPGWAAAIAILFLATAVATTYAIADQASRLNELKLRNALVQIGERQRSGRESGWFEDVWQLSKDAARLDASIDSRNSAVSSLAGLDAASVQRFSLMSSGLAFSADGKRLLIGGMEGNEPAQLWNVSLNQSLLAKFEGNVPSKDPPLLGKFAGKGPVTLTADGIPLQLVTAADGNRVLLYDVLSSDLLGEFDFPHADMKVSCLALSANGTLIGACGQDVKSQVGLIAIWNRMTGELVHQFDHAATAIAFSPDELQMAVGDAQGRLIVWHLADERPLVDKIATDSAEITALAFGRDPRARENAAVRWLLATGDKGGLVVIWDLTLRVPRTLCSGPAYHVHSIAFSPDGMTLGSVGLSRGQLWDTSSGRLLLSTKAEGTHLLTNIAFSPDGKAIAVSSQEDVLGKRGSVSIWRLETGRGIQVLRGLRSPIEKLILSADDRLLAAISHDCRIAIWDLRTERLLHVFDAPRADPIEHTAMSFDSTGQHLAYFGSSRTQGQGKLWDIANGRERASWSLPPGAHSQLMFAEGHLMLFQVESQEGRLYELPPENAPRARFAITECRDMQSPVFLARGRFLFVVGIDEGSEFKAQRIKAFDMVSGRRAWLSPSPEREGVQLALNVDREGRFLTIVRSTHGAPRTFETRSLDVDEITGDPSFGEPTTPGAADYGWNAEMPYSLHDTELQRWPLVPRGGREPVIHLDHEQGSSGNQQQFSRDGKRFAWGNLDGTVSVCDIEEVKRRLTEIGLGW